MATIVFDGDCGFCSSSARWLERHLTEPEAGGSIDVVAWQHSDLAELGLTREQVTTAAYWLADGETRRGARAVAQALQHCGAPWSVAGQVIDLPPVRPFAAVGYALVSRYRHRLPGGTPACRLER